MHLYKDITNKTSVLHKDTTEILGHCKGYTSIVISGPGLAVSSAQEEKSVSIYNKLFDAPRLLLLSYRCIVTINVL